MYQHGVYLVPSQKSPFKNIGYHYEDIIGRCCVSAVKRASNGKLYIGTDNDGIYIIDQENKTSKHLSPKDNPNIPNIIIGMFEDSEGFLWIGSYGSGAIRMNTNTLECTKLTGVVERNNEPVSNIYDFAEDNQKRLWIATMGGGLQCFDLKTGKLSHFQNLNTLVNNWIGCILYLSLIHI